MRNLEYHLEELYTTIRKIRDQFGDDKCWMDWHALFALLPEGYTPPQEDIAVQLIHCERYLKCRADGTKYVPPPRWVVGPPDQFGLWIVVHGPAYSIERNLLYYCKDDVLVPDIHKSFGPIPKEP